MPLGVGGIPGLELGEDDFVLVDPLLQVELKSPELAPHVEDHLLFPLTAVGNGAGVRELQGVVVEDFPEVLGLVVVHG